MGPQRYHQELIGKQVQEDHEWYLAGLVFFMSKQKSFRQLPCFSPWLADGSLNPYSLANT